MIDNSNSKPVNKTAALILSKGVDYTPKRKILVRESKNPFLVRKPSNQELGSPTFTDCTGLVVGRLTVIGMVKDGKGWSCRCSCGMYCVRKGKAILNKNNTCDRCEECRHLAYLKREDYYRRTGKDADTNDY